MIAVSTAGCRGIEQTLRRAPKGPGETWSPAAYLVIGDDGMVTVICHRSEMGQGVRTSIAMLVADELEADWARVKVEQAPGDEEAYGSQNTDGSCSIRDFFCRCAKPAPSRACCSSRPRPRAGACPSARSRPASTRSARKGGRRRLGYGELVAAATALPVPGRDKIRLKDAAAFRYIGKEIPIVDLGDMTTGRARYGMDSGATACWSP